jgi:hypothetical protein
VTWLWSLERRALRAVAVAGFLATLAAGIAALRAVLV